MSPNIIDKRPSTPLGNSGENKFKPFQPEMPRIPGVSDGSRHAARGLDTASDSKLPQILIVAVVVLAIVGAAFLWARKKLRASIAASTDPEISENSSPPPPAIFSNPVAPIRDGPSVAGTVDELSKPWASRKFNFVKPITHESVDAIVIRLPSGEFWAFSLQAPYGTCKLDYVTNLESLASTYRFRASHPMVVNPCDSTVFDPLKVGAIDSSTWARGQVVQGGSLRPPFAIEVKVSGRKIIAENIE